jgi:SAM-dependent methyltransferase
MTVEDIRYFKFCFDQGLVKGPLLEIGSRKVADETHTFRDIARDLGVSFTLGVDLFDGPGVDLTRDFSIEPEDFARDWNQQAFQTVVVFNVLEHTFDPLTVLKNALHCVSPGGYLIALAPVVWPIHRFPKDYNRLLPDWYEAFAGKHGLALDRPTFCWVSEFGLTPIDSQGDAKLPTWHDLAKPHQKLRSRLAHRVLNTFGRSHRFTYCALGAVFRKGFTS